MWEWWSGGKTNKPRSGGGSGADESKQPTAADSQAMVAATTDGGMGSSGSGAPAPGGDADGFWGYTSAVGFRADFDPALDDMLQFYGFAHQRSSDYSGAVCFKLTYPDGQIAVKTVQVLPKGESQQQQEEQRRIVQEREENDANQALVLAKAKARPAARMRTYPPRLAAAGDGGAAAGASDPSSSTALVPFSHGLVSAWLPAPCVSLAIRTRVPPEQTSDALVPSSAASSALAASASSAVAAASAPLTLPCSPRVRVYSGPVPKHVKLSATLSCPRDVFFDVYMGRLDPMTAVLTGKAHCSGYRYMQLLHFGQAFTLESSKWKEFYAAQEEVQQDQRRREAEGGVPMLGPGGSGSSVSGGGSNGGNATLRLTRGHSDAGAQSHRGFALPPGSDSGALAFAPSFGVFTPLALVDWARCGAATAASRFAAAAAQVARPASPAVDPSPSDIAAFVIPPRCSSARLPAWRSSVYAHAPPPSLSASMRSPSAAASFAPASVAAQLRSFYRFASHLNAHTNVTFACDEYA